MAKPPRLDFAAARRAENAYARDLRRLAKVLSELVSVLPPTPGGLQQLERILGVYKRMLEPWAEATAQRMLADVDRRSKAAWNAYGSQISRALAKEISGVEIGPVFNQLLRQQVHLITSLPDIAARKVHELTKQAMLTGTRAETLAGEVQNLGDITRSRANLIARTEVARTNAALTQARAQFIGSQGYTWRTMLDGAVRPSHQTMEGKFVAWDNPPTLDRTTGHAGCHPNCRCLCDIVLPQF